MKIRLHCYIINYYLTQWTDNRMPDKRGTDNRGSTVFRCCIRELAVKLQKLHFADKVVKLRKVVLLKHMFVCNSNSF